MDSGVSGEAVDVALLLAPLPRDRIELFVAELIANHPDEFPHLLAMAHKPVDSHELSVFTQNTLNSSEFSPVEVLNEFSPWLERCQEYLKANHAKNSLIILDCISPPLLDWISAFLKENRQFSSDDEEFQDFEIFLGQLESCWQSAMKQIKIAGRYLTEDEKNSRNPLAPMPDNHEISSADLAGHFQHLGKFKAVVSGVFGPIFSDALREYKKKIEGPAANGKILGNDKKKQKTEEK